MDLPSDNSIQTQITDGVNLVSQVNENTQILQSVVSSVPQVQTVLTDNVLNVSSVINAPFIEVTSVNGMTGDVLVSPIMEEFLPNHFYSKNVIISYNNQIYWAKQNFTSGNAFNANDWNAVDVIVSNAWNDITGKPNFATVATSGSYNDLLNRPSINNGSLTIKRNNTLLGTFTANSSTNTDINITVPTRTSELTNNSGFITTLPVATAVSKGIIQVGGGLNITSEGVLSTQLGFVTESTSGGTKIIRLQDGTTTSYPITTKEAVLGLDDDKFDASFLYDCVFDSTAFTQEQAEALKEAILADKEILIYETNQSTNKGLYKPYYVSASEDSAFKTINVQYINQTPAQVLFSFMSTNGANWTLTVRTTPL